MGPCGSIWVHIETKHSHMAPKKPYTTFPMNVCPKKCKSAKVQKRRSAKVQKCTIAQCKNAKVQSAKVQKRKSAKLENQVPNQMLTTASLL